MSERFGRFRRRRLLWLLGAAVAAVGLYLSFGYFQFHLIFIDDEVSEAAPEFASGGDGSDLDELIRQARQSVQTDGADGDGSAAGADTSSAAAATGDGAAGSTTTAADQSGALNAQEPSESTAAAAAPTTPPADASGTDSTDSTDGTDATPRTTASSAPGGGNADAGSPPDTSDSPGEQTGSPAPVTTTTAPAAVTTTPPAPTTTTSTTTTTTSTTTTAQPAIRVTRIGTFVSRSHPAQGTAVILTDGTQTFLRFDDDFETDNGPGLRVYLSPEPADAPAGRFDDDFVDLGPLKGNVGAQNFAVSASVDLDRYTTVVVWCDPFNVAFGAAALVPVGGT